MAKDIRYQDIYKGRVTSKAKKETRKCQKRKHDIFMGNGTGETPLPFLQHTLKTKKNAICKKKGRGRVFTLWGEML